MRIIYFTMNLIERYQKARQEIEQRFLGLPYMHTALIGLLLSKAHFSTGIVENITYQDLCDTLVVKPAPGRKDSGAPSKSTLRSVLRTIESTFQNDFKIISEGQHLILQFITLPQFFNNYDLISEEISDQITAMHSYKMQSEAHQSAHLACVQACDQITDEIIELSTKSQFTTCDLIREEISDQIGVVSQAETLIKPGQNEHLKGVQISDQMHEEITDPSTVLSSITVNNNKQITNITSNSLLKNVISEDFYPNDETIREAQAKGLLKVTDPIEIQKFIEYNQRNQNRWSDFNPIFIKWLERSKINSPKTLRKNDERYPIKSSTYELTMQAVLSANKNARAPTNNEHISPKTLFIDGTHSMAMGSNDSHLWPTVCE